MSEDQGTEWKASWRDEYLKWQCGFANAQRYLAGSGQRMTLIFLNKVAIQGHSRRLQSHFCGQNPRSKKRRGAPANHRFRQIAVRLCAQLAAAAADVLPR